MTTSVSRAELADLETRVADAVLEERLAGLVENVTDSPPRPAAAKLANDQARVLVWLLDGFDSRGELLRWMQELIIQSLGRLDDEWYADVAADATMVSALLGEPWGGIETDDLPPGLAAEIRRGVVVKDLLPAFRQAHREFRWSAGERVDFLDEDADQEENAVDPTRQQYPAMRPALGRLADRTEWALTRLLDGFADEDSLLLWVQSTVAAVHAEVDEEAIKGAYFDAPVRDVMLDRSERARFIRRAWAAEYLLPAFNRAALEVAERAGEVISGEESPDQSPMDW